METTLTFRREIGLQLNYFSIIFIYFKGVVFEFEFLRNVTEDRTGETYFDL